MTVEVKMYTTQYCPFCMRARNLMERKGVEFTDIPVDGKPALREEMMKLSGRHTVPQIWINDKHIGGFDDLATLERQNRLDEMLGLTG